MLGQRRSHGIGSGLHQRTMERRADRQRDPAFEAMFLGCRNSPLYRTGVARDYHLRGIIVVGDGAYLTGSRSIRERLRSVEPATKQRRHRANTDGNGRLHRLPAQFE